MNERTPLPRPRGSNSDPPGRSLGDELILLGGQGARAFNSVSIEAELRAMWKSASLERGGGGGAVYRAAMSNLVVPVDSSSHARVAPVLVEVTRRHPSRLFLVEVEGTGNSPELRAQVTALCHLRNGGGLICSEQIILRGESPAGGLVPSAVRALLVGDLPTVVLDIRSGPPTPWLDELASIADLVLVDSMLAIGDETRQAWWERIEHDSAGRIRDIAWSRITPWRELLAEAFDQNQLTPALAHIQEAVIEHGGGNRAPTWAWLLAGWLSSRLGLKFVGRDAAGLVLQRGDQHVHLRIESNPEIADRSLRRVRLRSGRPTPLDLEVKHTGRSKTATVELHAPRRHVQEVPYVHREFASCIVGEIHRHEPNPVFCDTVRIARELWAASTGKE